MLWIDSPGALASGALAILRSARLTEWRTAVAVRSSPGVDAIVCAGEVGPGEPVTGDCVFYGASLTKQIIGVLIAQLVESGVMTLEGGLHQVLPDLPSWTDEIRLGHVLHHTSGLPLDPPAGCVNNLAVLGWLVKAAAPVSPPGAAYEYSNVGYICLALAAERAAGDSIAALTQGRIFKPLGMTLSSLGPHPVHAIPSDHQAPRTIGDGGLWTTAADLLRWNDAMNSRFFGRAVHDLVETTGELNDGTKLEYAWGVRRTTRDAGLTITHGGQVAGWAGKTVRCPDIGTSVALLTTCDEISRVSDTALAIADWMVSPHAQL